MTITIPEPTGEVKLIRYCFPIREHYRSSHFRDIGDRVVEVSDSEVDAHTRCLVAGIDTGLAQAGVVENGYSVTAFRAVKGTKEVFVSRIYFRTKAEAEKFIAELSDLVKPSARVGWTINTLKQPKPAIEFDKLDYAGKIKEGINQLRTRLGDDSLDLFKLNPLARSTSNAVAEALEAAKKAQKIAEDVARNTQQSLNTVMKKLESLEQSSKKIYEELARSLEAIARGTPSEIDAEIAKLARKLTRVLDKINKEEELIKNLQKLLKEAKKRGASPEEIAKITKEIGKAKRRLKTAKDTSKAISEVIDAASNTKAIKLLKRL